MQPSTDICRDLWRRIRLEFIVELPLLQKRWKYIVFGALFQYVHGIFTQLAHRMHMPTEVPLHDLGFELLPELGLANEWVSETIFTTLFVSFLLWSFSPFVTARKRFYTAVTYSRLLMVLVACQTLRIISFSVTQLPAPNYHCRLPETTAVKEWTKHWYDHLLVDVKRQSTHGCGDLIFSSHTTFMLTGVLTYTEYGSLLPVKIVAWFLVGVVSTLIVASRKHYTVDVIIAWYVVPLVFYTMHRRWTTKRPVRETWPHRPLVEDADDEAAVELEEIVVSSSALQAEVHANVMNKQQQRSSPHKTSDSAPQSFVHYAKPGSAALANMEKGVAVEMESSDGESEGSSSRDTTHHVGASTMMMRPRGAVDREETHEAAASHVRREPAGSFMTQHHGIGSGGVNHGQSAAAALTRCRVS